MAFDSRRLSNWYASRGSHAPGALERLGGKKLVDITPEDVTGYQLARLDKVSPRTVNLEMKVLRHVLRTARLWARLSDDYKPLKENRRGPGRALLPEQEQRLFSTAQKSLYWSAAYYAAMVAANTTMRGCELKALRLCDVDLMNRTVTIPKSKTDGGRRVIPLNDAAVGAMKELLKRAALLTAKEPEDYLFPALLPSAHPGARYHREGCGIRSDETHGLVENGVENTDDLRWPSRAAVPRYEAPRDYEARGERRS